MAVLKQVRELALDLSERLELPEEALLGAGKISVTAGRRALVENHRGILEYGRDRIVVGMNRGQVRLNGSELQLLAMNKRELLIGGRIQSVEWE